MKKATSVISLLIGLLIISILAIGMFKAYYGLSGNNSSTSSDVKQQVDEKIQEIEDIKNQSIELQKSIKIDY